MKEVLSVKEGEKEKSEFSFCTVVIIIDIRIP